MDSSGRRCWFVVDSKSFDLFVELVGGKLKGVIVERERGRGRGRGRGRSICS